MKPFILRLLVVALLVGLTNPLYSQTADDFNPGADLYVRATAIQTDGKILVVGDFTSVGGQSRNRIGRLNPNGTLDALFNPGANSSVYCVAVQADGRILVAGLFTTLCGQPCPYIGRLNSDGTLDTSFNAGANGSVSCLTIQPNEKVLVAGAFTTLGGQTRYHFGRLNSNGTLDTTFNPAVNGGSVLSLVVQSDGEIIVGGRFTTLCGATRNCIGRLDANGILDPIFNPGVSSIYGPSVNCLALQADGKILVGGSFESLGSQTRNHIGRLNPNGTLDTDFDPGLDDYPMCLAVQADGRIVVGGHFYSLGGQPRSHIGRLFADGTLDPSLNQGTETGVYGYVLTVAVQTDGKILLGGSFQTLAGQARSFIGRYDATDAAAQSLASTPTTVTWLRGGVNPEVRDSSFHYYANGTNWVNLGAGTRISGGWQLTGILVPTNAPIRARGYVSGGNNNASSWYVESVLSVPTVLSPPASLTNSPGSVAQLSVSAAGLAPLSYQWRKGEMALADGGNVSGSQTSTLTLSSVMYEDEGGYSVVITNSFGSVTSLVATLAVSDPFIAGQPVSRTANAGETAAFSVTALGTAPLNCQWRKDGGAVAGATTTALTLSNLQRSDAGSYDLVVSNAFGMVTSAVALLTVNLASVDAFNPTADNTVYATANQSDGKIVLGGAFTSLGPQTQSNVAQFYNIGRINADGTPDTEFKATSDGTVDTVSMQTDGKILVGGSFTKLCGQSRFMIGRLNSDGTLDTNFNPVANSAVYCLGALADSKIMVGGAFYGLGGQLCTNIGRLNPDGMLDTTFHGGGNGSVYSVTAQPDGKILVAGAFTALDGQPRSHLGRLNADGSLDPQFAPSAGGPVSGLAMQADGKILVGGYFLTLNGQRRNYIGRLNPDGSLDGSFDPGANDYVFSLAVQADGKIQVGGNFTMLGGQARNRMGRLNADGTLDLTFDPGADGCVYSLALQTDGTTLVGGSFATLGGQPRNCIGRLIGTDPAIQSLVCDTNGITWLRDGSSPEFCSTTVEVFTKTKDWVNLGTPKRIAGGWQLTGVSVPPNATIRARGLASGGQYNRSSWFVETNLLVNVPQQPCRFISVCRDSNGVATLRFSAPAGSACTVEASTDLLTWEAIGSADDQGGGTFFFEDITISDAPERFYRFYNQSKAVRNK
jgi:uncharacterized delta-60 repeat protein